MRAPAAPGSIALVDEHHTVILEVNPGSEPLTGRMRSENGTTVEFTGWLELAAALERLQRAPTEPPTRSDARPTRGRR